MKKQIEIVGGKSYTSTGSSISVEEDTFFDRKGLSGWLGLSESRISELLADEGLPSYKIGRSRRYRKSEVLSWLQKRRQ